MEKLYFRTAFLKMSLLSITLGIIPSPEKIVLDKLIGNSWYEFVDVSPDSKYALLRDGCYTLVNLDELKKESYFCSKDFGEKGERKGFFGWIVH